MICPHRYDSASYTTSPHLIPISHSFSVHKKNIVLRSSRCSLPHGLGIMGILIWLSPQLESRCSVLNNELCRFGRRSWWLHKHFVSPLVLTLVSPIVCCCLAFGLPLGLPLGI